MMRTEPGQMQMTQGLVAASGGISGPSLPSDGPMFAMVFGEPLPVPDLGEDAMPAPDAAGSGAVIASALGMPPLDAGAIAPPDLAGDQSGAAPAQPVELRFGAQNPSQPSVLQPTVAAKGSMATVSSQTVATGPETASILPDSNPMPDPRVSKAVPSVSAAGNLPSDPANWGAGADLAARDRPDPIDPARPSTTGGGVRSSELTGPPQANEKPPFRRADALDHEMPAQARGVGGDGMASPAVPAQPATRAVPAVPPSLPADAGTHAAPAAPDHAAGTAVPATPATRAAPAAADHAAGSTVPATSATPAVPATPATRAAPVASEPAAGSAVPATPATPAVPSASGRSVPAVSHLAKPEPAEEEPALAKSTSLPSDRGRAKAAGPDTELSPENAEGLTDGLGRPVPTKAERVWLGRLHWQHGLLAGETEGSVREGTPLAAAAGVAFPFLRASNDTSVVLPEPADLQMIALQATEPEEPVSLLQPELSAITWPPSGQPPHSGSVASGPLPAGAVPQLAAAMVATLHQRSDGTTEIALSPDELGSVRLRLEADTRDPERMVVHLVFDRPETMDLFRRHADQLSEAIRAAGYAEARLDFGQSGTGADPQGDQTADTARPAPNLTESDQDRIPQGPDLPSTASLASMAGLDLRL